MPSFFIHLIYFKLFCIEIIIINAIIKQKSFNFEKK